MNEKAEAIKKRYRYRRLILTGKIGLSRHVAVKFIGADTAYHLYACLPSHRQARATPQHRVAKKSA